jgi:hypothetical protein
MFEVSSSPLLLLEKLDEDVPYLAITTMRLTFKTLAASAALFAVAACSEPAAGPRASASSLSPTDRKPSFELTGSSTATYQFALTAAGGTFVVGDFTVSIPANAVCDPARSSYGDGTWDSDCVTLGAGQSLAMTATVMQTPGGVGLDVQPSIRFSPKTTVTVSTASFANTILANKDYYQSNKDALRPLALYYSTSLNGARIADYVNDKTLKTHVDFGNGRVWRRIKHFSGYNITTGQPCDPSPDDPYCVDDGSDLASR